MSDVSEPHDPEAPTGTAETDADYDLLSYDDRDAGNRGVETRER